MKTFAGLQPETRLAVGIVRGSARLIGFPRHPAAALNNCRPVATFNSIQLIQFNIPYVVGDGFKRKTGGDRRGWSV